MQQIHREMTGFDLLAEHWHGTGLRNQHRIHPAFSVVWSPHPLPTKDYATCRTGCSSDPGFPEGLTIALEHRSPHLVHSARVVWRVKVHPLKDLFCWNCTMSDHDEITACAAISASFVVIRPPSPEFMCLYVWVEKAAALSKLPDRMPHHLAPMVCAQSLIRQMP